MARVAIINPRFEVSYWGFEHALHLFGKKANLPNHCLALLAALTPPEHDITLIDENVEDIDFHALAEYDVVGVTGMSVQRFRMREIFQQLRQSGVLILVGGPWVTVYEDYFDDLVDVIFVGEADETWPQFLREWEQGEHKARYEQAQPTDMTKLPPPRFDLMKSRHYMFGSLQFTRGCPFQCEFCDIIVIFGRQPRLKTSEQVIAELEALVAEKMEIAFVVDDNLIGNKKAIKLLLRDVIDWQEKRGYPLTFFSEASLDLAEDEELLQLMVEANFVSVFIGIETPNEESLRETKKLQNIRGGGAMVEKIHKIQNAGLEVWCGMILGFDHDDASIFDTQREFLQTTRIALVMIGMLYAIPKTPLYDRLHEAGRLDHDDPPEYGTNVVPARMTRAELRDGYVRVLKELYDPGAYFDRLDKLYLDKNFRIGAARSRYLRRHPWSRFKAHLTYWLRFVFIRRRLLRQVPDDRLRKEYRLRIRRMQKQRRDSYTWFAYALMCGIHYHHHALANQMANEEMQLVSSM
jgi:radical SAM superfamily enzyme YgiQ (UPF0313 family)